MRRIPHYGLILAAAMLAAVIPPAAAQQIAATEIAGGSGGSGFSDLELPADARVTEVRVWSGEFVDSVQMIYTLPDGRTTAGPQRGGRGGRSESFLLQQGEYIVGLSGRYGDHIDSIRIHTNRRTSSLYGGRGGDRDYRIDVPAGNLAVGLAGRAGDYLDAIGLTYTAISRQAPQSQVAGGRGGTAFADSGIPAGARVAEVRVRAGDMIDSVQMVYVLPDGRSLEGTRHGGSGGRSGSFRLEQGEYIVGISGRYGDQIDSLRIHTNRRTSPVYGGRGGNRDYRIEVPSGAQATGFAGRAGDQLDAIGLTYASISVQRGSGSVVPLRTPRQTSPPSQTSRTPLTGDRAGSEFADSDMPAGARVAEVRVSASHIVHSVQVLYESTDGRISSGERHGSRGGTSQIFRLEPGEFIVGISGRYGANIDSLRIHTNRRASPLYGGSGGDRDYRINVPAGNQGCGFTGRSGQYLNAIGLIYTGGTPQAPANRRLPGRRSTRP